MINNFGEFLLYAMAVCYICAFIFPMIRGLIDSIQPVADEWDLEKKKKMNRERGTQL